MKDARTKFVAAVMTVVILGCGLGSLLIVGVAAVAWAPDQQDRTRTRDACERALAALFSDWSPRELQRVADPQALADEAGWEEKLKGWSAEYGAAAGSPRGRITRLTKGEAADSAEYFAEAAFAKRSAEVTAVFVRRDSGPWKLQSLELRPMPAGN